MGGKKIDALKRWHYNARDCAATIGAYRALAQYSTPEVEMVYRAQMALEACTLAIQSRGILIDTKARKELLAELRGQFGAKCNELGEVAGHPVNPNSPSQVQALFYDELGLKRTKNKDGKVSVDRETLTRITKKRIKLERPVARGTTQPHLDHCANLATLVLEARALNKDVGMVKARLEHGRMHTSINVGATESFRFSASKTNFGTGANLQQVKHALRSMFVPDPGMVLVYGDQDRAESTAVAHLSGDPAYIAAHAAHDTHVEVAKLIWPDAGWTGDDEEDLALAKAPNFIRFFSRRDMSKRTQHALNYYPAGDLSKLTIKGPGPHHTLARMLQIKEKTAYEIVNMYFRSFPGIAKWQAAVISDIKTYQRIYYPSGFYRDFFGRPHDAATHRQAISSIPQVVVAWTNHIVMFRLWEQLETKGEFEMLMHNHDAVLLQCDDWERWRPRVEALTTVVWPGANGEFSVPWSWETGSNWEEAS